MTVTQLETPAGLVAATAVGTADDACARAVDALGQPAELVLAFASSLDDPAATAAAVSAVAPGAICAGMSGNGAISAGGAVDGGCAAIALGGSIRAGLGVARDASRDLRGASAGAVASALESLAPSLDHRIVLLFIDTRSGDQSHAVAGAYEVAGPQVPLAGGAAGGAEPFQLAAGEAHTDSVVAVALSSPRPIGIGVAHACELQPVPALVTRSEGRSLIELDGRPAVEVYLERLGRPAAGIDDAEFEAIAVTHPLAQPELNGDVRLRHVLGREGAGALRCATHIPANAAIEFTVERPEEIVRSTWDAVSDAVGGLGDAAPQAALVFDCAGRKRALGGGVGDELAALAASFGAEPPALAGLYTHGEVGRTKGAKGDRNHAIVVVALA